jgi:hypothetical protein
VSTLEFPTDSGKTTGELFTWQEVKALLDKETMRRAEYVSRLLLALKEHFGDEVMHIARQVIYDMGYEKGQLRARMVAEQGEEKSLESLADLVAHKIARLYYGTTPLLSEDQLVIRETYCALPLKWKDMGMPDDQLVEFCLLFDQIDRGMVEGYNPDFAAELTGCRSLAERGYCQMVVRKRRVD